MKTKKLFLKLFFAAFFLALFVPKNAHAANGQPELNIGKGNIYIGTTTEVVDGNSVTKEVAGYGTSSSDIKDNVTPNHTKGYTITGMATAEHHIITIDVPGDLRLTFEELDMMKDGYLDIKNGNVEITLSGAEINTISSTSNNSAIKMAGNSALIFRGNGAIALAGSPNAITGTTSNNLTILSGTVTLSGTVPFKAGTLLVDGGTLNCYDNGQETYFGSDELIKKTGTVNALGLVKIIYKEHKLTDFPSNTDKVWVDGKLYSNIKLEPDGSLAIKEDWFGKTLTVQAQTGRQGVYIPPRDKAPHVTAHGESVAYKGDGYITGFNHDTMEYQGPFASNDKNQLTEVWTPSGFDDLPGLSFGYYFVRTKATDTAFASEPAEKLVEKGPILEITPPEFTEVFGYNQPEYKAIEIHNYDKKNVIIDEIRLSNENAFELNQPIKISGLNLSIQGESNNEVIQIRPKIGLPANPSHTTTVTIAYKDPDTNEIKTIPTTVNFTVEKASQNPPTDTELKVEKFTHNSATLIPLSGTDEDKTVEYGYTDDDGKEGKWQTGTKITGLSPSTSYVFHARYAGDANHNPSDSVSSSKITTDPAAYIDYKEGELVLPANRKYTVTINDKKTEYTSDGYGRIKLDTSQFDKKAQIKILDQSNDGEQTLTVNPPAKTPTTPKATDETISGAKDGSISGVSTAMEYRIKTGKNTWTTWDSFSGRTLEDQAPGTYEVRVAATDSAFASKAVTLIIGKGRMLDVTITEFDEMKYGTDPVSRAITIENLDKDNPVNIQGVTVASNAFTITDGDKTIEAQKTSDTWKVQPKAKLNVDTYTAELTVTYNDIVEEEPDDNPDDETQEPGGDTPTTPDDETTEPGGDTPTTPDDETKEPGGDTPTTPDDETQNSGDSKSKVSAQADENAEEVKTESRTVTVPVEVTVVKADQDAPPVPAEKSKTATSITLETIANNPVSGAKAQYSKDGGRTWQDSPTFTGLSANKDYTFVARYAETENYNASDISNGEVTITTSEKNDDDSKSDGVKPQTTDKNNSNGTNGNGTNGTNGNGSNTNGTNGSGTGTNNGSGTNGSDGSSSNGVLSSAKTGDLNNIQLWVALMIGSYLSCAIIIKNRLKKSNS